MNKKLARNWEYAILDTVPTAFEMDNFSRKDRLLVNIRIKNMTDLFKLNWKDVLNALAAAVVGGVLAMIFYVLKVGDIFGVDFHSMINVGAIALLTGVASLIQTFFTTSSGNFVGILPTK